MKYLITIISIFFTFNSFAQEFIGECPLNCEIPILYSENSMTCYTTDTIIHSIDNLDNGSYSEIFYVLKSKKGSMSVKRIEYREDHSISENEVIEIVRSVKYFSDSKGVKKAKFRCTTASGEEIIKELTYFEPEPIGTWEYLDENGKPIRVEQY